MKTKIFLRLCLGFLGGLLLAGRAEATSFTLTTIAQGNGVIYRNPTNTTYPSGVTVTLRAAPAAGWYFGGWSGNATGTVSPLNVIMTNNLTVTGLFLAYPMYSLAVTTNGQGAIDVSPPGGSYLSNTVVTATATAAAGWVFTGWSGGASGTTNPLSLTINNNTALTGNFAELPAFTTAPQNVTNVVGSTVSFSAAVVGTSPLAYQWYFNSVLLPGATSSTLTVTDAPAAAAGYYQLVVTNAYGSTNALAALVLTNSSQSTNVVSVCDEAGLQAAIAAGGWISIGCSGTITLTSTLDITNQVILDGEDVSATISGGNLVRLFYVAPGASLSLTNLTLANGTCLVTNGTAPASGGAIYNDGGTVSLTACTLTNNSAIALVNAGVAEGGAIYNSGGTVSIYYSVLADNLVLGGSNIFQPSFGSQYIPGGWGYGGALFTTNGSVLIMQSTINGNLCSVAGGNGGGAYGGALFEASGCLSVTNSLFATNVAAGGNAVFNYPQITQSTPAAGGALAMAGGNASIGLCQFVGNKAQGGDSGLSDPSPLASGGAIYSSAVLAITKSSFFGNESVAGGNVVSLSSDITGAGGAICNLGTAALSDSAILSNYTAGASASVYKTAERGGDGLGGGIFNSAQMTATNCTIALNMAANGTGASGGANGGAEGGGLYNSASAIFVAVNDTFASNACPLQAAGFAAGSQIANTNGTVELLNSLLAYGGANGNAYGVIADLGDNISSDGSASFGSGSSYNFTDPLLTPLANNGGPTLTMALLAGSPAIAFADSSDGAPPDDQRGYARPTGYGVIDLGAYQSGATQIYAPPPTISLNIVAGSTNVVVTFNLIPAITNAIHFQTSTNLSVWTDLATYTASSSPSNIVQTINPHGASKQFFRLVW